MFRLYPPLARSTVFARGATSVCQHASMLTHYCQPRLLTPWQGQRGQTLSRSDVPPTGDFAKPSTRLVPGNPTALAGLACNASKGFVFNLQRFAEPARVRSELSDLVTVPAREMAQVLGVHEKTLLKWARERRVPCVRVGKVVRFRPAEVLAALEQGATREVVGDE